MAHPTLILLVKFKTSLSHAEVLETVNRRKGDFQALEGLQQKYYLQEPATGEYAGLYLWKGEEAFTAYRDSELRKSIAQAYKTIGEPRIEIFNVVEVLRD